MSDFKSPTLFWDWNPDYIRPPFSIFLGNGSLHGIRSAADKEDYEWWIVRWHPDRIPEDQHQQFAETMLDVVKLRYGGGDV